ncbi:hypothetical protein CM240_2993 [Clostridium bornimense]|uniref:Type VII secretion system protein EssD-like domain-containing protein n=1 Tax=Clostridium bornimense TaxID=1216932 RepID=W6SK16_9CLOT|nr:DNA/RNA non-specific endonuclease [Clostridium bornimense]CDM70110.1 hypothetical protein CM240_2993 [Clostridium bornimense]
MKKKSIIKKITFCTFMLLMLLSAIGCVNIEDGQATNNLNESTNNFLSSSNASATISDIPAYSGKAYIEINENKPNFSASDLTTTSFEKYSPLDELGRCGVAFANVGTDIMPTSERESISSVKPTGWQTVKYDSISGKYLYNRCHLIGFQLTAENANELNLITGTRYLNVDGMLPFENMVADYVKETNNHVLYRVTPVFEGNDLVAKGVQIEAMSVEDNGEGIEFNVFIYNVQPGITIDYSTGNSALGENTIIDGDSLNSNTSNQSDENTSSQPSSTEATIIRGNSKSKIYHCPGQRDYENMADSEYLVTFNSENEAIEAGYRKAKR